MGDQARHRVDLPLSVKVSRSAAPISSAAIGIDRLRSQGFRRLTAGLKAVAFR
jgi:hypothetical protein